MAGATETLPATGITSAHVAILFTVLAVAVHKTKRKPSVESKLRESLWGIGFQPFSLNKRVSLAVCGACALLAILAHAARTAGPGVALFVAGTVTIVFRRTGVWRTAYLGLRSLISGRGPKLRSAKDCPLPVWVLTGFLGSGKTTLVNRLVRSDLGNSSLLVVENEAGDTRLDAELVVQASGRPENVLLVKDGCACCSVRGDLCDLLRDEVLGQRAGDAAGVVIECSGLADPRAVVQTFLLDDDLRRRLHLREVVAVVDAAHVGRHFRPAGGREQTKLTRLVEEQIAFASLVLLNKVDVVRGPAVLDDLTRRIRDVNRTAEVLQCSYCDIDLSRVLGGAGSCGASFTSLAGAWSPDRALIDIERVHLEVGADDAACRSVPTESAAKPGCQEGDAEEEVRCVSIRINGDLDLDAFNRWVLRSLSDFDILRAKGVLAVAGREEKLAFQAVHGAFNGTPGLGARWRRAEPRFSEVIVIGCGIQPQLLEIGLRRCLA